MARPTVEQLALVQAMAQGRVVMTAEERAALQAVRAERDAVTEALRSMLESYDLVMGGYSPFSPLAKASFAGFFLEVVDEARELLAPESEASDA